MRTRAASPLAIAGLVFLSACTQWSLQPLPQGPQPSVSAAHPLRVTRAGGGVVVLSEAEVRGDSLYGTRVDGGSDPRVAFALSEVTRAETASVNTSGPALLAFGAGAILLRWVVLPWVLGDIGDLTVTR